MNLKSSGKMDKNSSIGVGKREAQTGYHLVEAYHSYLQILLQHSRSELLRINLTQWRILTLIRFNPDKTQRVLSTAVGIDPSSMTPIIGGFEKKGWVRRHRSQENRSAYALRLTAKGIKSYQNIEKEIEEAENYIKLQLGTKDYIVLRDLLHKLHSKISGS